MPENIAIIGAGVSGLTCGVLLAEGGRRTTILADETGQGTTSAAAGAIWYPYDAKPAAAVIAWALETYEALAQLSRDPASGVSMLELRTFARTGRIEIPAWALELGARPLVLSGEEELGLTSRPGMAPNFTSGFALIVPLTDSTIYLDYLAARFRAAGGVVRDRTHLENLEQVPADFDLIINCAGIGARHLVGDTDLEPHRGQVAIVSKIDLPCAIVCDDAPLMYAIPRSGDCLFGGTNDLSENRAVDPADTSRIVAECSRVLRIESPPVVAERVGLRPFRKSGVRLAKDQCRGGRAVIHNYGHGGSGFTLSWGCARSVVALSV